jgi:hypothetical protein
MLIDRWKLSPEQVDEIFFSGEQKGVILWATKPKRAFYA